MNIKYANMKQKITKQSILRLLDLEGVSLTKIVLSVIAVAGFLTVVAALPGLPIALAPFVGKKRYTDKQLYTAYRSLERHKYIQKRKLGDGGYKITPTKKGLQRIASIVLDVIFIQKPKRWDGKWRFVIFDIPSCFKGERDGFRVKLENLGFVLYQRSVWAYPYPCEKEVMEIAQFFEIAEHVDVVTAEKVYNELQLKKLCGIR